MIEIGTAVGLGTLAVVIAYLVGLLVGERWGTRKAREIYEVRMDDLHKAYDYDGLPSFLKKQAD